jgi:hypothetical protein
MSATSKSFNRALEVARQPCSPIVSRSVGDVVFGMEDGTVSIFGLVFGVAASTDQSSVVLPLAAQAPSRLPCP